MKNEFIKIQCPKCLCEFMIIFNKDDKKYFNNLIKKCPKCELNLKNFDNYIKIKQILNK